MNPRVVAIAQACAVLVTSSFAGVLSKLALREVPAFTFVWLQIAIGGILLTAYTFGLRRERIPRGLGFEAWAYVIWIGIANFAIVRLVFMLSLERLPATTHVYLVNFVGIVTMLMSVFLLRERPSAVQVLGALVAVFGLRVFFREIPAPDELTGVIYGAVGVLALASTNNVARKLGRIPETGLSNSVLSTLALWIGGLPVVLVGLVTEGPAPVEGAVNWGIITLNAVVSIAVGLTVWNYILRTLRSYEASVLAGSTVIFTALFAIPILGERLEMHEFVGIALMLVGLGLAQMRGRRGSSTALHH